MNVPLPRLFVFPLLVVACLSSAAAASVPASYLEAPSLSAYGITSAGFTVECWIRVRGKPGFDPRIVQCVSTDVGRCETQSGSEWGLAVCNMSDCPPGVVQFEVEAGTRCVYVQSSARVDDGRFHHLAGVYDGAVLRILVDGEVSGELPLDAFEANVGGGHIVIGNANDYRNPFDGVIDEFRIWKRALSPEEIRLGMNREIDRLPAELVAYWKLDGDGRDATTVGNHLIRHRYVRFVPAELGRGADVMNVDVLRGAADRPGPTTGAGRARSPISASLRWPRTPPK